MYATVGIAATIFHYQRVPEAMGKSLEELSAQARKDNAEHHVLMV